jgi:phosphoglycolate phosphatase/putative hydrolase of the HAD superfamily
MTGNLKNEVNWEKVRGVVFDVDGTLYDQRKLRMMMLTEIGGYFAKNANAIGDLRILHHFRKVREELAKSEANNVRNQQFEKVARKLSTSPEHIADVVENWIYKKPLKYMEASRFAMVDVFFDALRLRGLKIGIFSDYPVEEKLAALKLNADAVCYSLETGVDRLKPQTLGLETVLSRLSLNKAECVFIGDRDSRDAM